MDKILAVKPIAKLENADSAINNYVLLLERELGHWLIMKTVNESLENTVATLSEELRILKLQRNKTELNANLQEQINKKLKKDNTMLELQNNMLNQQIITLQNGVKGRNTADKKIKTSTSANKIKQQFDSKSPVNIINNNNDPNSNSIFIKGFAEHHLNSIPKVNILNLARLMNLKLLNSDIVKVTKMERKYYERHNLKPNNVILIVQFRTAEIKVEFLKNKEKLKASPNAEELEISDYVSDEVYNLYQYAKVLKKDCGYAQIYWRNNCVYAKKTPSTYCEPVLIRTKDDVDFLKAAAK